MQVKTFNKILHQILTSEQFEKKGGKYFRNYDYLICVVSLQRSNFSSRYYINVGYVIKHSNPGLVYPSDLDADIRTRMRFEIGEKSIDFIDLEEEDENDHEDLIKAIRKNVDELIKSASSLERFKSILKENTSFFFFISLSAKQFLGIA